MNKFLDFFKNHKYAIIWTIFYVLFMWCILKWLFNFDMFVLRNWVILAHAKLRGFPGFVFGILILAAIPMYIATTIIIIRTKKPLISLKVPSFMQPVPDDDTNKEEIQNSNIEEKEDAVIDIKPEKELPTELRPAFIRARAHIGPTPKSNFDISNISAQKPIIAQMPETDKDEAPSNDLPIPDDFNENIFVSDVPTFTPVFSDINFDEDLKIEEWTEKQPSEDLLPVTEYLNSKKITFWIEDGLILTNQDVIAAHNDPDFWIADNETWFASGKQKASPADKVLKVGTEHGLRPILYLGQTNILDIESRISDWSEKGIHVITNLDELK